MDKNQQRQFQDWESVEQAVTQLVHGRPDLFAPAIVANVQELVAACHSRCSVPSGVGKGYWDTVSISWAGVEIEVFEDRYELYRFGQGDTKIEYFDHVPGTEVPLSLLSQLSSKRPGE